MNVGENTPSTEAAGRGKIAMMDTMPRKILWTIQFVVNAVSEQEALQLLLIPGARRESDKVIIEATQDTSAGVEFRLKQMFPEAELGLLPHRPVSHHLSGG